MAINLVFVSMFVFIMLRLIPGDPSAILGQNVTQVQVEQFKEIHGLNHSLPLQYVDWATGILTGDFGKSYRTSFEVRSEFLTRLPRTAEIVLFSFSMATTVGILGGILSATKQNSSLDFGFRVFAILGLSVPQFLLLTLLLIIPTRLFNYSPPFGAIDFLKHPVNNLLLLIPPTALLAIGGSASLMRLTRTAFLDVFRQDYMRTARAKGLNERAVTYRHGFRNALPPVMTLAGLQLGNLLGGSIILEQIFNLQGLGLWLLDAITFNDYPVIMAAVMWNAVLLMMISLLIDLGYAVVDPRIRYS